MRLVTKLNKINPVDRVLRVFYRKTGELENEVQIIKEAMPFYYQITNDHGKGADKVMEAERYYYMGNFENSEIVMHQNTVKTQLKRLFQKLHINSRALLKQHLNEK